MSALIRIGIAAIVLIALHVPAATAGADLRESLLLGSIEAVRIDLNPWGAQLGFEAEVAGDDPRVEALAAVIREAEPGEGHKCPNAGAIRFFMADGRVIGVGLLPGHSEGRYGLRLYEGDRFVAVFELERATLMDALDTLGVPLDDPALRS